MTHTDTDKGEYGAKRASYEKRNFRFYAYRLLVRHPDVPIEELDEKFMKALLRDKDAFRSLRIYGLQQVKRSLRTPPKGSDRSPKEIEKEILKEQASEIVQIILMTLPMPSGKTLGDSTGKECAQVGGWLKNVAKVTGPDGIVNERLTETDLQELFKKGD